MKIYKEDSEYLWLFCPNHDDKKTGITLFLTKKEADSILELRRSLGSFGVRL